MMKDKYDQWLKDVSSQTYEYVKELEVRNRVLAKAFSKDEAFISRRLSDETPFWEAMYFLHRVKRMRWDDLLDIHTVKKVKVKKSISGFNKKMSEEFDKWVDDAMDRMSGYLKKEKITNKNLADEFESEECTFSNRRNMKNKKKKMSSEILFYLHTQCKICWDDLLDGPDSEEQMIQAFVSDIMDEIKDFLDCSGLKKMGADEIVHEIVQNLQKEQEKFDF